MKQIYTLLSIISFGFLQAQVGIGTTAPDNSCMLELSSPSKGFLTTRVSLVSTTDTTTITAPATGLLVYNLSTINDVVPGFYYWDSVWKPLKTTISPSSGPYWSLGGNTISSSDFLGSVNYNPLQFRVNNSLFGKFHPNGGITLGFGANANDNNSIALGTNANASASNQAVALGPSANAAGYQSVAIGLSAATSNNSTVAIGSSANASGYQSVAIGLNSSATQNNGVAIGIGAASSNEQATALGFGAGSSGQNSTAIGYQATATQANSIILGNSANAGNKIGIGTNSPDERLHVVGSLKLVDGTQGNGYVLTSDANGKAKWQNTSSLSYYGDTYYNGSGQTLNQFGNISFGGTNSSNGMTINSDGITVSNSGIYKITYRVTIAKSAAGNITIPFNLYKNFSTIIPGSLSSITIGNNETFTLTGSVIVSLNAFDKVSLRSGISDTNVVYQANGTSLSVEIVH